MNPTLLCFLASVSMAGSHRLTPSYTVYDLGTPDGGSTSTSFAMAINSSGNITGYATSSSAGTRPFFYNYSTSTMTAISSGGTGTNAVYGRAINDYDVIAGYVGTGQGFIYNGSMNWIPNTVGSTHYTDVVYGINNSGTAVGKRRQVNHVETEAYACYYTTSGGTNLGITNTTSSNTGYSSIAYDINDASTPATCGMWHDGSVGDKAYTKQFGHEIYNFDDGNVFYSINNDNVACGVYATKATIYFDNDVTVPSGWTRTYQINHLNNYSGGTAIGWSINASKCVAGESPYTSSNPSALHAFFFDGPTQTLYDLNSISDASSKSMILISAHGINDSNWICGYATVNSVTHAFLAILNSGPR